MRISFTIDGPPAGKARARSSARAVGDWLNPKAIVSVHADPQSAAREADIARLYRIAAGGRKITAGPVRLHILAIFPRPESFTRALERAVAECRVMHIGRPDLDNIEKLVKDALNGQAWRDDGQVAEVTKRKRYGSPARTEVTVEHMAQAPDEITPGQRALEKRVATYGWDAVLAQADPGSNSSKIRTRKRRAGANKAGGL